LILKTLSEISATNKVWSVLFVGGREFVAEDQILWSRLLILLTLAASS